MPFYSYADNILFSTFTMSGLLPVINEKVRQFPDISFQLINSLPPKQTDSDWIYHWLTPSGDISLSLANIDNDFLLRFPSLADFVIDGEGSYISAWLAPDTDEETLQHLLLDQVLPRVLALQGRLVLHSSAVSVDGRIIAFIGDTGQGKSTLAASFHIIGFQLLTDDGLVLKDEGGNIKAIPAYSGLRLLPESVAALFKELPQRKVMASYSYKERVSLGNNDEINPVELKALFVLGDPNLGDETKSIRVSRLSQRDACMELVRNSFQLDISNHAQVKTLFAAASSVAEQLPVFSLTYPRDFSRLPDVHDAILQQLKKPVQ
jgi:hypothetical protein